MPIAYTSASFSRMRARSSRSSVSLVVSLPSEMISRAFLRWRPSATRGTESATASYSAVPPRGRMSRMARLSRSRLVVQSCSRTGV